MMFSATGPSRPLVVLDALLVNRRPTGVGRSILELCRALAGQDRGMDFLVLATEPAMFPFLSDAPGWRIQDCPAAAGGTLRKALFTQFQVPRICTGHRAGLLHSLQFVAPLGLPCPSVVTVHDLGYLLFPRTVEEPRRTYYRFMVPRTLARASAIVTNSRATASDTLDHFPFTAGKVHPTCFGTPSWVWSRPPVPRGDGNERPFFLFVGTLEPRKNLERLLAAYERFLAVQETGGRALAEIPSLLLVGGKGWKDSNLKRAMSSLQERGHLQVRDYCDTGQLWNLYGRARALLFPSLHEGFGFPILEAMAAGLPVLTADRGAMAEVGGEGVLPVDPENTRDIVRGMTVLAWDRDLRFRLAEAGPQLARRWNWDDTAQLTVEVYQRALLVPEGKK